MRLKTRFTAETNEVNYITKNSNNLMIASNYTSIYNQLINNREQLNIIREGI